MNTTPAVVLSLILAAMLLALVGCTTVGRGRSVLVRQRVQPGTDSLAERYFQALITDRAETALIALPKGGVASQEDYEDFVSTHLPGRKPEELASFGLSIRDRTSIPPFLAADFDIHGSLVEIYKKDLALLSAPGAATSISEGLTNLLADRPDLVPRTTVHHVEQGRRVFFYYPRVQLDFSARLASAIAGDRFSYLALLVRLTDATADLADGQGHHVRVLDLEPKQADFVEYSEGKLTQSAQLVANANLGRTAGATTGSKTISDDAESSVGSSRGLEAKAGGSFTLSDEFVKELKTALEKRTVSILEDGRTLLVELRATDVERIGGTYTFDLVLEVPSTVQPVDGAHGYYEARPIADRVEADVRFVGLVRQVARQGRRGWFHRVPEPTNDRTYEQVVLTRHPTATLWRHHGITWTRKDTVLPFEVAVHTNREDARFQVRDTASNEILAFASGAHAVFRFDDLDDPPPPLVVEFLPILVVDGTDTLELIAPARQIQPPSPPIGSIHVTATYAPKPAGGHTP